MNALFRIFVFFGSLVVILLFAALLAPYFINWDKFTSDFERQASKVVGQPVQVGGDTKLRLLPLPFLYFNDLKVGSNADGTPMMTVDEFSLKAELFPFLSGEVRIVEINMDRPKVNVQVEQNGTIAWTQPGERVVNPDQVNIEALNITNGELVITGLTGGRELLFEKINANVNAKSLIGPWRIDATTEIEQVPSTLKIQTGSFQEDRSIRLKIEAEQNSKPYSLLIDGPLQLKDGVIDWSGKFDLRPFSEFRIAEMFTPVTPLPINIDGEFQAGPDRIQVPEYRMEIGSQLDPYTISGDGNVEIDEEIFFRFNADGRQIDLDKIKTAEEAAGVKTLEARLGVVRDILERIPVPTAKGEIRVSLPAMVAGDTYIRDVSTVVRPLGSGWDLRNFSAKFPGNTTLEAQGRLGIQNEFGFDGKMVLASLQPSGFASWVAGNVDPTFRGLNQFGIASQISLSTRQIILDEMELRMDDVLLTGKLSRIPSSNAPPAIILKLLGNRINIDELRAIYSLIQPSESADQIAHDLDIDVNADVLEANIDGQGVSANGVDAKVKVRDGSISVDRFNAENFYSATINSTGRIENLLSRPNGNMKLSVTSENIAPLLSFSKKFVGDVSLIDNLLTNRGLTENANLNIELDTSALADGAKGKVLANGIIGGTDLDVSFGFDGSFDKGLNLPISIEANFENSKPSILMQQMGIDTMPTDITGDVDGPINLNLDLSGVAPEGLDAQISIQLPDANIASSGKVFTDDWDAFSTELDIRLGADNIAPYAVIAGINAPALSADKQIPASISAFLKSDLLEKRFEKIEGQIAGNDFQGSLLYSEKQVARPRISGNLTLDVLDLDLIAQSVFGQQSSFVENIVGDLGLDPEAQNFTQPYYGGLDADLKIKSEQIEFGKFINGTDASLRLVMLDGSIDINQLDMNAFGGRLSADFGFKNTQGVVLADLNYAALDVYASEISKKLNMPSILSGKVIAQGAAEASGKSIEALVANLSGNGLLTIKEANVTGLYPSGFDTVLLETGVDGYEIKTDQVQLLVEDSLLINELALGDLEAPYSITRGQVRVRNASKARDNARLDGDMELDLADMSLNARLNMSFDPGRREAIKGAEPQVELLWNGPLEEPKREIATARLESYLSLRAFEQSQRRIETLEAKVLETQRLQQQIALSFAREQYLERLRLEEEARLEAERLEAERIAREQEAARLEAQRLEAERLEAERVAAEQAAARAAELQKAQEAQNAQPQISNGVQQQIRNNLLNNIENFLQEN